MPRSKTAMSNELFEALSGAIAVGDTISTVARGKPNTIAELSRDLVLIETERSRSKGTGPQPVAGWMLQEAWDQLRARRRVTYGELVASDGFNMKRASAVCALLASLPDVCIASTQPIRLELVDDG